MANIETTSLARKPALSAVVGAIITVGVTVAAGSTLYFVFDESIFGFSDNVALNVENLSAKLDSQNDRLIITGTIRNIGTTSIESIIIDELSVTDLRLTQNGDLDDGAPDPAYAQLSLRGQFHDGNTCTFADQTLAGSGNLVSAVTGVAGTSTTTGTCGIADTAIKLSGVSTGDTDDELVSLEGRSSTILKIELEADGSGTPATLFDVSKTVDTNDQLLIIFRVLANGGEQISNEFKTKVTRG